MSERSSNTNPGQKLTPKPAKIITADKTFEIPPNASSEQYNNIIKNCLDFIQAQKLQNKPITVDNFQKEGAEALKKLIKSNVPVIGLEDDKSNSLAKKDKQDIKLLNRAAMEIRKELKGKPITEKDFAQRLDAKLNQMKKPAPTTEVNLVDNEGNNIKEEYNSTKRRFEVKAGAQMNQASTSPKILARQALTSTPLPPANQKKNTAKPPTPKPSASPSAHETTPRPLPTWAKPKEEAKAEQTPRQPSLFDLPTIPRSPLKIIPGSNS